jgi:hypothetical protein
MLRRSGSKRPGPQTRRRPGDSLRHRSDPPSLSRRLGPPRHRRAKRPVARGYEQAGLPNTATLDICRQAATDDDRDLVLDGLGGASLQFLLGLRRRNDHVRCDRLEVRDGPVLERSALIEAPLKLRRRRKRLART